MLGLRVVTDFGDSKGEGNSLDLDLFWKVFDDRERRLEGLEDNSRIWGDLDGGLGESGGLGVASDCDLGVDEGVLMSFEGVLGVWIFLDVCKEVLRKPEFRRGRFWNVSPNSSTEVPWKTRGEITKTLLSMRSDPHLWSAPNQLESGTAAELQTDVTLLPTGVRQWLQFKVKNFQYHKESNSLDWDKKTPMRQIGVTLGLKHKHRQSLN